MLALPMDSLQPQAPEHHVFPPLRELYSMPYHSCQCIRNYLNMMMLLPPGMEESVKTQGWIVHVQTVPVGENRTQLTVLARAASVPTYLAVGLSVSSCLTCMRVLQPCKVF